MYTKLGLSAMLVSLSLMIPFSARAQLWGQWPMAGVNDHRDGKHTMAGTFNHSKTAGSLKWSLNIPDSEVATGFAIGDYDTSDHDYHVYVATGHKVYCFAIDYDHNSNTFTPGVNPVWTYNPGADLVSDSTPVLGKAGGGEAVYICTTDRRVHCINASTGSMVWRSQQLGASGVTFYEPFYTAAAFGQYPYRVYAFGYDDDKTYVYAFESFNAVSPPSLPDNISPVWTYTFDLANTPWLPLTPLSRGDEPPTHFEEPPTVPYLYFLDNGHSYRVLYDRGSEPSIEPCLTPCFSTLMPGSRIAVVVGEPDRIYLAGYYSGHGGAMAQGSNDDVLWDDNDPAWLRTMQYGGNDVWMGHILTDIATDAGAYPTIFAACTDEGCGTSRAALLRIRDNYPDTKTSDAYWMSNLPQNHQPAAGPVYIVHPTYGGQVYVLSDSGSFLISGSTGAIPIGWPKSLGVNVNNTHLAVDDDGAVLVVTQVNGSSVVRAYWGR